MISVSFFLHPNRQENLKKIHDAYKDYDIVDEVLVVTGKEVDTTWCDPKFKFVHMPGPYTYGEWPSFGLLSRYTFALSCKNRFVFMQDDDFLYDESTIQKMFDYQEPIIGCHYRWFYNNTYNFKPEKEGEKKADIILTGGTLIDTDYVPDVVKLAKDFWTDYQNVFNGEDVFLSRALSYITGKNQFRFIKDNYSELPRFNYKLAGPINNKKSRRRITRQIYDYFEKLSCQK